MRSIYIIHNFLHTQSQLQISFRALSIAVFRVRTTVLDETVNTFNSEHDHVEIKRDWEMFSRKIFIHFINMTILFSFQDFPSIH